MAIGLMERYIMLQDALHMQSQLKVRWSENFE